MGRVRDWLRRADHYVNYVLWSLGHYSVMGSIFVMDAHVAQEVMATKFATPYPMPYLFVAALLAPPSELYIHYRFREFTFGRGRVCPPLVCSYVTAISSEVWALCIQFAYGWFIWPALKESPSPGLLSWPLLFPHYILLGGWIASAAVHCYLHGLRRKRVGPRVLRRPWVRRWMRWGPVGAAYVAAFITMVCSSPSPFWFLLSLATYIATMLALWWALHMYIHIQVQREFELQADEPASHTPHR